MDSIEILQRARTWGGGLISTVGSGLITRGRAKASAMMLTLLSIGILTFSIQSVRSELTTIVVPDDYPTIQEAVNNANEGDTVYVRSGAYYEHVAIPNAISLIGENRETTIIDGGGSGTVVNVGANNVTLKGFTVRNSLNGLYLSGVRNCRISGNNVADNNYGLHLFFSSSNTVSGNNITNNGAGLNLWSSSSNTVSGNNITNNGKGVEIYSIDFYTSSSNTVSGNNITNNKYGLYLRSGSNNKLRDNRLAENQYNLWVAAAPTMGEESSAFFNDIDASNTVDGKPICYWIGKRDMTVPSDAGYVALVNCANITVQNLNLSKNGQGILLAYSTKSKIIKNNMMFNECGLCLRSSSNNTVSGNNIANNKNGLLYYASSANSVFHNNFDNNADQVNWWAPGSTGFWDDGYPSGGNYWSNHITVDEYSGVNQDEPGSDGIVDEPYIIDDYNQDNYPLLEPWSPVISATIDVAPDTLHLMIQIQWITCYIELPEDYNIIDIYVPTILLNDTIPVDPDAPTEIGDHDSDGVPDFMVKFDRTMVSEFILSKRITEGYVTLTITGEVDGAAFQGTDTIRVLMSGGGTRGRK